MAEAQDRLSRERKFFFSMAAAILLIVLCGFGSQLVTGRAWFTDFPWQVHVHVAVFSSWIILYVVQNWVIVRGEATWLHRCLGWLGAGIAALMVPLGIAGTMAAIARGSINGVFPLGFFLALDVLHMLGFGALTLAGILLRNDSPWHKRLMLCGTVLLTAPALSRLFGLLHLKNLTPLAVIATLLALVLSGIVFDRIVWRRVHPAYWWGLGTISLVEISIVPVGFSTPVIAFAQWLAR